jgi:hypothetical protein
MLHITLSISLTTVIFMPFLFAIVLSWGIVKGEQYQLTGNIKGLSLNIPIKLINSSNLISWSTKVRR